MSEPTPVPRPPTGTSERAGWWASLPDPVVVVDQTSNTILDVNPALEAAVGRERDSLKAQPARGLVGATHAAPLDRLIRLAAKGEAVRDEVDLLRREGGPLPVEVSASPGNAADGRPVVLLVMRDITRRREAEDEIHGLYREFALLHLVRERIGMQRAPRVVGEQVLEALLKILTRDVGAAIYLAAGEGAALDLVARRRLPPDVATALGGDQVAGGPVMAVFESREVHRLTDLGELPAEARPAFESAGVRSLLMLPLRSPGRVHGVLALLTYDDEPLTGADSDLLSAVATETGMVLEHGRLERQLRKSEERYREMVEASPLGYLEVARTGEILWANETAAAILRRDKTALPGLDMSSLYRFPEERERLFLEWGDQDVLRDRAVEFVGGDGESVFVSMTSRRVPAGGGLPERCEDVIRDITEERELHEKLLRTEKLASLGQMISGIAHELNNPLTGVLGYAQLLEESDVPDDLRDDIEKISTDAMRCKRIIENLMRFARKEKPQRGVVSVNEEIETVLELRRYQLSVADVRIERQLSADLPYTLADPHQLQQVFLNLINNAADAIKGFRGSGTLTVASVVAGGRIRITFRDDGPGIAAPTLARIFDPFFTTKEVGKGTGLGLSVSYGIIREHGGEITAESEEGKGTAFHVDLPVEPIGPPQTRKRDTTRRLRVGGRGAEVLVVDDEPSVLAITQRALDDDGYRTTGVADGAAALAAIAAKSYDAVVTDLSMAGMDGRQLAERIVADHPALQNRIVILTGNVVDGELRRWLEKTGTAHLAKPFPVRELRKLVRRVIDEA